MPEVTDSTRRNLSDDCLARVDVTVNGYDGERNLEAVNGILDAVGEAFDELQPDA